VPGAPAGGCCCYYNRVSWLRVFLYTTINLPDSHLECGSRKAWSWSRSLFVMRESAWTWYVWYILLELCQLIHRHASSPTRYGRSSRSADILYVIWNSWTFLLIMEDCAGRGFEETWNIKPPSTIREIVNVHLRRRSLFRCLFWLGEL